MAGTAGKYHINANGDIEKCTATVRSCPYGVTGHYDTPGEAKVAMEKIWKEKVLGENNTPTLSKKNNNDGDSAVGTRQRGIENKRSNNEKANTEQQQLAEKYLASRDESIKKVVNRSTLRWWDKSNTLVKSINATVSQTDPKGKQYDPKQKQYLSDVDKYQMKAADQLGNKTDLSRGNPEEPWMPCKESSKEKKERVAIDQHFDVSGAPGYIDYTSADSWYDYNNAIGGRDSAYSVYAAREGLTGSHLDDEIGIDSTIGIAPVQSLNYQVDEDNNDYDVIFTVTDDDLIRAGVNKNSISNDNPDLRFSADLSDPVLYKNARYMQAYIGITNRQNMEMDDSRGKDDSGEERAVYLDSKPMLNSIDRMRIPGVDTPSWVFTFRGKAAIDPDEDPDYLYS